MDQLELIDVEYLENGSAAVFIYLDEKAGEIKEVIIKGR